MTTPSSNTKPTETSELNSFLEQVCETDPFKVEKELGYGYVKLRSTEAEKRQAAQDIRCVEDIVIELLRNSRDAGAKNIFLATSKEEGERTLTIIDDGVGIPPEMWEAIFEPRVTSKLETAHMDKWGMHGRGMALYSTRVHALRAQVASSLPQLGTSLVVKTDASLAEKSDQSTFPTFENNQETMVMRGPKNIVRTCCEFALEQRNSINVYVGTPAQITAALYEFGLATIPAYQRAFAAQEDVALVKSLGLANIPEDLAQRAHSLGLDISLRTARRIIDGQLGQLDSLYTQMQQHFFEQAQLQAAKKHKPRKRAESASSNVRITAEDKAAFTEEVMSAFGALAQAYYLDAAVNPNIHTANNTLVVEIPLVSANEETGCKKL